MKISTLLRITLASVSILSSLSAMQPQNLEITNNTDFKAKVMAKPLFTAPGCSAGEEKEVAPGQTVSIPRDRFCPFLLKELYAAINVLQADGKTQSVETNHFTSPSGTSYPYFRITQEVTKDAAGKPSYKFAIGRK